MLVQLDCGFRGLRDDNLPLKGRATILHLVAASIVALFSFLVAVTLDYKFSLDNQEPEMRPFPSWTRSWFRWNCLELVQR